MDIRKLQRVIVDGLEDVKAQNIVVFNTEHLSPLFERVVIASGTSNRQTKSLAASVRDAVKASGEPVPRVEGEDNGEWIIVDCGAAVVHVMQPQVREYYHLEELWGEKPVKMKLDGGAARPTRTAGPDVPARREPAPRRGAATGAAADPRTAASKTHASKTTASKTTASKTAASKPAAGRGAAPKAGTGSTAKAAPKRTAAKQATASRAAAPRTAKAPAAKKAVTRTTGVKRTGPAAPPAARRAAAPARKTAPRKAPSGR
jgi:ribosome-associated protein